MELNFCSPGVCKALWIGFGAAWLAGAVVTAGAGQSGREGGHPGSEADNFPEAVDYYLKGNWFEAQQALMQRLGEDPRDADARLMLATLCRHTGRLDEAQQQLDLLARLEESAKWGMEIRRERQLLRDARAGQAGDVLEGPPQPERPASTEEFAAA